MNAPRRCPTPRSAVGPLLALALLLSSLALPARTQAAGGVNTSLWVANGNVIDVALSGTTLYIGGAFTYVGPLTGGFAALDAGSGVPNLALPPTNGTVRAVVPDGSGGWYIGGEFTTVGGYPRNRLAHLKAGQPVRFLQKLLQSLLYDRSVLGQTRTARNISKAIRWSRRKPSGTEA